METKDINERPMKKQRTFPTSQAEDFVRVVGTAARTEGPQIVAINLCWNPRGISGYIMLNDDYLKFQFPWKQNSRLLSLPTDILGYIDTFLPVRYTNHTRKVVVSSTSRIPIPTTSTIRHWKSLLNIPSDTTNIVICQRDGWCFMMMLDNPSNHEDIGLTFQLPHGWPVPMIDIMK